MMLGVWAPDARDVVLRLDSEDLPLTRDEDGWWRHPFEVAEGVDYGFIVDGEGPLADPRSLWQPQGVHGPSRTLDLHGTDRLGADGDPEGSSDGWRGRPLEGAVIYELHLGTFTPEGTLDAAARHFDHLRSIGVDFIELLPVNAFNGEHGWGYDGVLWFAVHEPYGGPAAYRRFVDAAHAAGLGVIQDVVYNHLGPSGNVLPRYGPYLHEQDGPWGSALNLDGPGAGEVRRYIIDNAMLWLRDYGVDGLRLDAVHALHDTSQTHILAEIADATDALAATLARPLHLIAESDLNDPVMIEPRPDGYGLTAQWSDDFHHALHVALTGEVTGYYADFDGLAVLKKVLTRGFFHDGTWSSFREREHGRPIDFDVTPPWRLVVSDQNHDQIGNRARGDRLAETLDDGQLGIAAALTLLGPFTPMLFMGEEWAASTPWQYFTSHPEPELGAAVVNGRISEFARMGWDRDLVPDPQDPDTLKRSVLDWSEAENGRHARLLALYRELAGLRRSVLALRSADLPQVEVHGASVLTMRRGDVAVTVNFGDVPAPIEAAVTSTELLRFPTTDAADASPTALAAHSLVVVRVVTPER
ncbi:MULTISPECIES: malto-oligosyltrehalose trehalohydrolase [unclassified Leifsonia]|uniref:malto-oligosyltrehalose trehalohydrolase n=1 Tax=unclassified Leifsonia TaxID=2663824 RepID=UPI0006F252F6|nr:MULTISPECIES: malto-oligosyltrehalose trehalohydrolase [unclassified Leifsonia]KQX08088.1 malto-oligosyltrehalose trehalohydrolase [Leifsonia sp. Root1293]KRA12369.1 malto-oligosyltrehalose trehalohydrolase [Leifsonia sp. Root60]